MKWLFWCQLDAKYKFYTKNDDFHINYSNSVKMLFYNADAWFWQIKYAKNDIFVFLMIKCGSRCKECNTMWFSHISELDDAKWQFIWA